MIMSLVLCTVTTILLLSACGSGSQSSAAKAEANATEVIAAEARMDQPKVFVNGRELTSAQLEAFKQMYGAEGQGATGFMYPGHDLGPLRVDSGCRTDRLLRDVRRRFV